MRTDQCIPWATLGLLAAGIGSACGSGKQEPAADAKLESVGGSAWFEDRAETSGVQFTWESGHQSKFYFPEIMGGGAALFDMDADGDLDLYMVQGGSVLAKPEDQPGNQLFRNDGTGQFENISVGSGAEDPGYGMGVAVGDFDGDGREDLFVTNQGRNSLLRNDGAGKFSDVTVAAGLNDEGWSVGAAFFDYDHDGDLDLFVVNYIEWFANSELACESKPFPFDFCSPKSYNAPAADQLYRNDGAGVFTDVSLQVGLDTAFGNGLGIVVADFNKDGFDDVFVANDGMRNQIWINQEGKTFKDSATRMGVAADQDGLVKAGMGTHAIDADNDGDEDLLVVNLNGEPDSFFRNDGAWFSDRTQITGLGSISRSFTRFGMGFADFNQDGEIDLFQACGRVIRDPDHAGDRPYDQENLLFAGQQGMRFEEVFPRGGVAEPKAAISRAAVFGDVNGDGAVDVVVVNIDSPVQLLINQSARGNWITFRALESSGSVALGAEITASIGGKRIYRFVRSSYSYCAANDPRVHLGLANESVVKNVQVSWSDGSSESFGDFQAGQVVTLTHGASE